MSRTLLGIPCRFREIPRKVEIPGYLVWIERGMVRMLVKYPRKSAVSFSDRTDELSLSWLSPFLS